MCGVITGTQCGEGWKSFCSALFQISYVKRGRYFVCYCHGKDVELLDPQAIANSSNVMNCEWMNGRMLYATSCLAANLEAGAGIIADTITAVDVLGEDVQNGFHRIGILELGGFFKRRQAKNFSTM